MGGREGQDRRPVAAPPGDEGLPLEPRHNGAAQLHQRWVDHLPPGRALCAGGGGDDLHRLARDRSEL